MIHGNCKSQKNSLKQRLFFDAKSVFWHKNTLPCASFVNLGVFAIFSFNVCTEAVSVSPFVNLQWMATQVCFDTKTQAMQLFLTQKHTTVCVFCELRRFCNIFFQCLHRSSFRKPICQFAMNGNASMFWHKNAGNATIFDTKTHYRVRLLWT